MSAGMFSPRRAPFRMGVLIPLLLAACSDPQLGAGATPDAAPAEVAGPPEVRSSLARDTSPDVSDGELAAFVAGNAAFAADVYREAARDPDRKGKNLVFAPHSISTALAMALAGARGETAAQMRSTLRASMPEERVHAAQNRLDLVLASRAAATSDDRRPFQLHTVNALFGQRGKPFVPGFLDTLAVSYGAGLRVLDFATDPAAAREVINDWVEDVTRDKIVDLLPEGAINGASQLVLVNAIYFSAAWKRPFADADTAPRAFTTPTGVVDVKTMRQVARLAYGKGSGFRAAGLPFDGEQLWMIVVVPEAGAALATLEAGLDGARVAEILASLAPATLTLQLPAFGFRTPLPLVSVLKSLGMTAAFSDQADFSGILTSGLKIADVIHQAFIGVDEEGAEAAGATAVVFDPPSAPAPAPPAELVVDRPFLFLIADRPTGEVLFLGRVVDPRS